MQKCLETTMFRRWPVYDAFTAFTGNDSVVYTSNDATGTNGLDIGMTYPR